MKFSVRKIRIRTQVKTTIRLVLLMILLVLTYSYAMFQGGFVSWFLFFSFLPFFIYSFLIYVYPLSDFTVKRIFQQLEYNAGEDVLVTIILERKYPFPIPFLIVEDLIPDQFIQSASKQLIFIGFKRKVQFSYKLEKVPRGEHVFEAIRLGAIDFLGFAEKERWFDLRQSMLVYPAYEEMIFKSIKSRFEQGEAASAPQFQKDTSLIAGVRKYQPGDRFSWIDWKATARTNEMKSKEFEMRQSTDLLIIVDGRESASFEQMIKFTASVIRAILRQGGQTGLFSACDEVVLIPIRGGEEHQRHLFYHLAKIKPRRGNSLVQILKEGALLHKQSASILLVTSVLSKDLIESAGMYLRGKDGVIVYLIKGNDEILSDEETKLQVDAQQAGIAIRTIYEADFNTAFSEVKRA